MLLVWLRIANIIEVRFLMVAGMAHTHFTHAVINVVGKRLIIMFITLFQTFVRAIAEH